MRRRRITWHENAEKNTFPTAGGFLCLRARPLSRIVLAFNLYVGFVVDSEPRCRARLLPDAGSPGQSQLGQKI
jgi:hypothetical protein